jgi:hypothetical protein
MGLLASMDQSMINRGVAVRIQKGETATADLRVTVKSP